MAHIVAMPKLSDTMEEGAVAQWLKKEGDNVKEGEDIVEIETDKATMSFQAPASGVLLKIVAEPKKTVQLGQPICVIGKAGETFDLGSAPKKAEAPAPAAASTKEPVKAATPPASTPAPATISAPAAQNTGRVVASPLAKKVAQEKNIDLKNISGSGPNGRIVQRDLDNVSAASPRSASSSNHDRVIELSMMRKTIAKRLLQGKNEAPHFYLTRSANMEKLLTWRESLNKSFEKDNVKASVNDLVTLAVSRALVKHPQVNASWQGDSIIEFGNVHVALAVALPTGLVTPVIRNTDQLGVKDIAIQAKNLATKAKDGKLTNEDYAGGTFTISNLGMFGIEEFTAIINPPQAAILAVGAAIKVPAVDEKGNVVAQTKMKMTLSCDHRAIDGAIGADFLRTLVQYLEEPLMMLS